MPVTNPFQWALKETLEEFMKQTQQSSSSKMLEFKRKKCFYYRNNVRLKRPVNQNTTTLSCVMIIILPAHTRTNGFLFTQ